MPKYDDPSWHFSDDHADEAAYTHIAFFYVWAVSQDLAKEPDTYETPKNRQRLAERAIKPREYYLWIEGDKLTHHDLNDFGNAFAESYFSPAYFEDYAKVFGFTANSGDFYTVGDTWENFDRLADVLDKRFLDWCDAQA